MDDAKAPADEQRAAKQRLHLLRAGVGGHVVVLGRGAEQQVADGAPDYVGRESGFLQCAAYLERRRADPAAVDGVLGVRDAERSFGFEAEHLADELLDHAS